MDTQALYKIAPTVLISIATYFGGLFTEPAKKWLINRAERRRLRNALYAEMQANLDHFLPYVSGIQCPENYPRIAFKTEVYLEALRQPVLFRELPEAQIFSDFYEHLAHTGTLPEAERGEWLRGLSEAPTFCIERGLLSRRLLHRAPSPFLPSGFRMGGYPHPLSIWWESKYRQIASRNIPPARPGEITVQYGSARTLFGKARALWRGIPGEPHEIPPGPIRIGRRII
jgi:hypothetical protein